MSKIKTGKARMIEILKRNDIEMKVEGCGCCGSPWVTFKYKGEIVLLDVEELNFDTTCAKDEEELEDEE